MKMADSDDISEFMANLSCSSASFEEGKPPGDGQLHESEEDSARYEVRPYQVQPERDEDHGPEENLVHDQAEQRLGSPVLNSKPFYPEGYFNYLRLGRSLLYMKEPLNEPLKSKIQKLHKELLENTENQNWFRSKDDKIKKKSLCEYIKSKYLISQDDGICKSNLNIQKWDSTPWEIAKTFMQSGQTNENKGPEFTDVMGHLRLISGCNQFNDWLEGEVDGTLGRKQIVEVLKLRHDLAHSYNLCCSEEEMEKGIRNITNLMKHFQQNFKSFIAGARISDDGEKRIYQSAEKKIQEAFSKIDKVRTDTDFEKMRELVAKDICSSKACEPSNKAPVTGYDVLLLHCEEDTCNAINFKEHYLDTLSDLHPPAKTIIYDEFLVGGTGYLEALEHMLDECRLVFILHSEAFKQDHLAMFQAEVVKCTCLQKNEGKRVVPVYLTEQDFESAPKWMKAVSSIDVWKPYCPRRLLRTLEQGRRII